jgi:hypothetical protein
MRAKYYAGHTTHFLYRESPRGGAKSYEKYGARQVHYASGDGMSAKQELSR